MLPLYSHVIVELTVKPIEVKLKVTKLIRQLLGNAPETHQDLWSLQMIDVVAPAVLPVKLEMETEKESQLNIIFNFKKCSWSLCRKSFFQLPVGLVFPVQEGRGALGLC